MADLEGPSKGAWRLGHRPGLDGLRGVAVLLVIAAHLGVPGFVGGGATGVTLFFALSGFLITSLLMEERARSAGVSLAGFYRRRALRLLPAVLVVVAGFTVWDQLVETGVPGVHDALSALFYVANLARASGDGLGHLGQTWSLAIEEQFYLVWPVTLLLVARRPRAAMIGLVGLAAVVAIHRLALWNSGVAEYRVEFATDTRADAILLGCALGLALTTGRRVRVPTLAFVLAGVGLCLGTYTADFASLYRWRFTVAAIASTVMVAYLVTAPSPAIARLFRHPVLVWSGRRSYGLYLWHVPIYWIVTERLSYLPAVTQGAIVVCATLAAVTASWRFVERPLQERRHRTRTAGTRVPADC